MEKICKETNNGYDASKEKQVVLKKKKFDRQERKIQVIYFYFLLFIFNICSDEVLKCNYHVRQMLFTVKSGMEKMRLKYHDEFINLGMRERERDLIIFFLGFNFYYTK